MKLTSLVRAYNYAIGVVTAVLLAMGWGAAVAQETVCAQVKIELKQQLTLERQAFDAQMTINNALEGASLTDVSVTVKVTEENGTPVLITTDPADTSARFFVRLSSIQGISDVSGNGSVAPKTTAIANWLLIPAPGAAGTLPTGKKYLVGATLQYKFGGEVHTLDVSPDVITVKPMPLLTLDYFLTEDVLGDDPLTPEIEPVIPFTLGVRVKNTGLATAANLKIDSAQPKIVENNQGLQINFKLTGSYLNDAPTQNTLLINFGDVAGNTSKMGRWVMESTLAGRFVEFTARFSHADELGGMVTSLMQATNAHFLVRDVRVDLPGRDVIRDFLARDGDVLRVYESEGTDTIVQNLSAQASLAANTGTGGNAIYRFAMPATQGFVYVKLPDPFAGTKALGAVTRADGKVMASENVWLSRNKNPDTKQWEYWVNLFDANTVGVYDAEYMAPPVAVLPPAIQFIPDRTVKEGQQVAFLVEASSASGRAVTLSAAPLPASAQFLAQPVDPATPGTSRSLFDWTPAKGQAGSYLIVYTASDGTLSATRSATIKVEVDAPPPGPGIPALELPLPGAQVPSTLPSLQVRASTVAKDPTTQIQFEVYADEAMTQLVASGAVGKGVTTGDVGTTEFIPSAELQDNTWYWWRARAYDGSKLFSSWVNGSFFANLSNDAPETFNPTAPAPAAEVAELQPRLTWTNSSDKDGDAITYKVMVYRDAALTDLVTSATDIPPGDGGSPTGSTGWTVDVPLVNHTAYFWKVVARDANGAETATAARLFVINTGNTPPSVPSIVSPLVGGESVNTSTNLTIANSTDAENDSITYVFEIDKVNTFDSGAKQSSGPLAQGGGATTSWMVGGLVENQRYWWRVKAQDGRSESDWAVGGFLMNAVNEAPPTPTVKNPGNAAWTPTLQPTLEANPVVDPEGDAVNYRFEVYRDAALANRVSEGVSSVGAWTATPSLADKTTYWWRIRAEDGKGEASAWSPGTILYVSTGPYQDPVIQLTSPAVPVAPDRAKKVTLIWTGTAPNIESNVALYYGTSKSGYNGTLIVDGLRQPAGSQTGSYVWDVSRLAPGAYYVYAMIYDPKGMGRAYAPGAVVVPYPHQEGRLVVHPERDIRLTEANGEKGTFWVRLGTRPVVDVVVPLSLSAPRGPSISPNSLTFTSKNWNVAQAVTVTGGNSCSPSLNRYHALIGKAQTFDPNYIGLSGHSIDVIDAGDWTWRSTTNDPVIHVCRLARVSERKMGKREWQYAFSAELTNTGSDVGGVKVSAQWVLPILRSLFGMELDDAVLEFGAVASGETVKSTDTIRVRTKRQLPASFMDHGVWLRWSVTKR